MPPPTNPQYPENIREENCAQRPTAPTSVCPREAIIIVSTMEPVVVSRFCSATGTAITAIFFRNDPQGYRAFVIRDSSFFRKCAVRYASVPGVSSGCLQTSTHSRNPLHRSSSGIVSRTPLWSVPTAG